MNASLSSADSGLTPSPANTKPLWVVVGLLGAAVLAMGATLVYLQTRPLEPKTAGMQPMITEMAALPSPTDEVKPPVTPAKPAQTATKSITSKTTKTSAASPAVVQHTASTSPAVITDSSMVSQPAPVKTVCTYCGVVESSTPIQREGTGSGVGAVAGGVLGAVLGNQVGGGSGKTAATILGALGGGWAGNTVEKKMKKETVYEVRVRMEDGSVRTLERAAPVAAGARVTLEGSALRLADGSTVPALPSKPVVQSGPALIQTGG